MELLADELAGPGFTQTDHRSISCSNFLPPLSDTLITKIALLPTVLVGLGRHQGRHCHSSRALRAGPRHLWQPQRCPENSLPATRATHKSASPSLKAGAVRAKQFWRSAAALGCAPSPAGRFYALQVFGLVIAAVEFQLFKFTSHWQAGIQARPSSRCGSPLPRPTTATPLSLLSSCQWHGPVGSGSRPILYSPG